MEEVEVLAVDAVDHHDLEGVEYLERLQEERGNEGGEKEHLAIGAAVRAEAGTEFCVPPGVVGLFDVEAVIDERRDQRCRSRPPH